MVVEAVDVGIVLLRNVEVVLGCEVLVVTDTLKLVAVRDEVDIVLVEADFSTCELEIVDP